ncbi:MAG: hypothetical protein ABS36_10830 [Acidobacteria bacterium SCN 69-37]|nr:MAG: hypothetical protein ABS36_10830 [Acidobacteria bacterium SCN 69-37]
MHIPRPDRPRWWQWPTILSLDAPVILLAWQALAAHATGVPLGWAPRVVLAVSVWLAYMADRWIEAWRLPASAVATPRHRFHQRWRWPIATVAAAAFVADIVTAVVALDADDVIAGLWLALAAGAYVVSHQWLHRHAPWRAPKELVIALLLAAGVWLFVRAGTPAVLWPTLGLFALLCLTNTSLISRWEIEIDRRQGQSSLALGSGRARRWITGLPWVTALTAVVVAGTGGPSAQIVGACALASALILGAVDLVEPRIDWPLARVCSDAALLTPIVALVLT